MNYAYSSSAGGLFSPSQQQGNGRYIHTRYGAIIDKDHWTPELAMQVIDAVKSGKPFSFRTSLGGFGDNRSVGIIDVGYRLTRSVTDNYGLALAWWEDYEMKFETAQPVFPTFFLKPYPCQEEMVCSSRFAIEDLPTDYLSFWAAAYSDATGKPINDDLLQLVIYKLGGGESNNEVPPHCGGGDPNCVSQNGKFTPKVAEKEILHHYWGIGCPNGRLCFDVNQETIWKYTDKGWPDDLTKINGQPLVPINDDSWEVTQCSVNGLATLPGLNNNGCRAGRAVKR